MDPLKQADVNRQPSILVIELLFCFCFFIGDEIMSAHTQQTYEVMDVGIMYPGEVSTGAL